MEALGHLVRGAELDPRSLAGPSEVTTTYAVLGNWPEATRWAERGIAISPADPRAYYSLAFIRLNQDGSREKARQALLQGIQAAGAGPFVRIMGALGFEAGPLQALRSEDFSLLENVPVSAFVGDTSLYYEARATLRARQGSHAAERA